jgi:hypothetical protein
VPARSIQTAAGSAGGSPPVVSAATHARDDPGSAAAKNRGVPRHQVAIRGGRTEDPDAGHTVWAGLAADRRGDFACLGQFPREAPAGCPEVADPVPDLDHDECPMPVVAEADVDVAGVRGGPGHQLERPSDAVGASESQDRFLRSEVPGVRGLAFEGRRDRHGHRPTDGEECSDPQTDRRAFALSAFQLADSRLADTDRLGEARLGHASSAPSGAEVTSERSADGRCFTRADEPRFGLSCAAGCTIRHRRQHYRQAFARDYTALIGEFTTN